MRQALYRDFLNFRQAIMGRNSVSKAGPSHSDASCTMVQQIVIVRLVQMPGAVCTKCRSFLYVPWVVRGYRFWGLAFAF